MSKALSESKVFANWSAFSPKMRYVNDIFLMHMVCQEFTPKKVLEIGFFQGQTLGTLIDACHNDTQFVSVDQDFKFRDQFQSLYTVEQQRITWICQDSASVEYNGLFDLILIDGNHSYNAALQDLENVFKVSHLNTIIVLDDYYWESQCDRGVKGVIQDHLLGQKDWVPFLMGDQTMFFHHISHPCDEFLDYRIQEFSKNFIYFENVQYNDYTVLKSTIPNIFKDHVDLFCLALAKYDI